MKPRQYRYWNLPVRRDTIGRHKIRTVSNLPRSSLYTCPRCRLYEGKPDLHYCQRTTASWDCLYVQRGTIWSRIGNVISGLLRRKASH